MRCRLLTVFLALALPHFVGAEELTSIDKVRIGLLLPLSGQYSAVGADNQQGIEVAKLELANASRLDFVLADSKAEAHQSVSEFRKLTSVDKAVGVFAFRGPVGMSVNPLSKETKIPLLGGVGNKDFALTNDYAFQLWVRSDTEGEFLAEELLRRGFQRAALVTVQDDWPMAVSKGFKDKCNDLKKPLALDIEILPTETDFRSIFTKLRATDFDVIFLNVGLAQIAPFIRQLRQMQIKSAIVSNFWAGKKDVIAAAGGDADGLMFAEMSTNLSDLKNQIKTLYNSSPSGATLSAYVATIMLGQAIEGISNVTSKSLYESLLAMSEIRTKNGVFKIKDRFVQFPMNLRVIKDGQVADLE